MDTAKAAFKYRYSVIFPPQLPKAPFKPNPMTLWAAGVVAGLLFAILAAVVADLRSGRLLETWQVRRWLDLEVLAEVRR